MRDVYKSYRFGSTLLKAETLIFPAKTQSRKSSKLEKLHRIFVTSYCRNLPLGKRNISGQYNPQQANSCVML